MAAAVAFSAPSFAQTWGQPPQQQPQTPGQYGGAPPPQPSYASPSGYSSSYESNRVNNDLSRSERENSGRGLEWVWLNGELGFETVSLKTFKNDNLVDSKFVSDSASGIVYGAGLGVRLIIFTLGARFRLGNFSEWDLWTLNLEAGFHIPLGDFEPYVNLGGGYASVGAFGTKNIGGGINKANVDITGYNIRLGGGLDYYVTPAFSVGASVSGELLGLSRSGLKGLTNPQGQSDSDADTQAVYAADGSSVGSALTLAAVVGVHF
jgi:hypothetical protein